MHVIQFERTEVQVPPAAVPQVVLPRVAGIHAPGVGRQRGGVDSAAIGRDPDDGIPVPVGLQVVRGVTIQRLHVAANVGNLHAAGSAAGVLIARQVKRVAADGGVPDFADEPLGAVFVHVIAVAERGVAADDAKTNHAEFNLLNPARSKLRQCSDLIELADTNQWLALCKYGSQSLLQVG